MGTGTTARWAVDRLAERLAGGWSLRAVPTSEETAAHCRATGVPVVGLYEEPIAVAIDGADEVAPDFALTKGGGGALFREKSVALAAAAFVVIVTENKLVPALGAFPLPVEVVPFALPYVREQIGTVCERIDLRIAPSGERFVTDNGNAILDCRFGRIDDPRALDARLKAVHGVVATGLFVDIALAVLVGGRAGVRELVRTQ
jgi:ribose 5-phosphate isomerase A